MYLDWFERDAYVLDIETDSLDPSVIWLLCWKNIKTGEVGEAKSTQEIQEFFSRTKGSYYIGHNILRFDAPVLIRLAGIRIGVNRCIDTLILSTLYSPSLSGGHSLGAWGERLGKEKGEFSDFAGGLTPEMVKYCHQDVSITCELFKRLIKTLTRIGFSEKSIEIQHRWTVILDRQWRNGFQFDGLRAIELYQKIRSRESELEEMVHGLFPAKTILVRSAKAITKSGEPSAIFQRDMVRYEVTRDGDYYEAYERVPFNLGSPKQRVEKLLALGWKPEEFTPSGGPKPFDKGRVSPSLERFLEKNPTPEVELISRWMSLNGRGNMINTWLNAWNEDDGCIHGKLFVADTLRLRHSEPNTANIPAVRIAKDSSVLYGEAGYFTYESRDLWTARPGRVLVGTDAKGLELRMLAHYLNRPEFTKEVIDGDPHQFNAELAGVTRTTAKTLLYAIQYGAQAAKVASIMDCSKKDGAVMRQTFLDRLGLTDVMNGAINEQKNGRIRLCDGSLVVCPSPHAALNYKLQGGGARVMAQASIFLERYIREDGLDSLKVGDIHDEWQYDVAPKDADRHADRSIQAIREAGEELSLAVPLDGTAKKGLTWAETH